MKIEYVNAKQILVKNKNPENWFGVHYNMNIYRGCQHDCIYCDSRSDCYQIENFNDLTVKMNAAQLLEETLSKRKKKVTIGTGSMSDPYIPAEKHIKLTEKILKIILKYKYPFHIITKSDLILRDIELLKEIQKTFLSVCFTITTCNDELAQKIEPKAPLPSKRLKALQLLSEEGIYSGILFQPVLPFLLDNEENITDLIYNVAVCGGKFIIPWFAVTMRQGQKEYFLNRLDIINPGLKRKYLETYNNQYICNSLRNNELYKFFEKKCKQYKIHYKMQDINNYNKINPYRQMTIFDLINDESIT